MAETFMLKEKAGPHFDKTTGVTVRPGDTIESDLPLDKLFRSKWINTKDVSKAKAGKKHVSIEAQEKGRTALLAKKKAAARKPTKEQVLPVKHETSPAAHSHLEPEAGTGAEEAEEATKELMGQSVEPNRASGHKGTKNKAKAKPEEDEEVDLEDDENEEADDEVEEEEETEEEDENEEEGDEDEKPKAAASKFGEDVSDEFDGTEDAGLKVFKNDDGAFTVTTAGKTGKALNTEELKNKTAVKKFLKEQAK